MLWLAFSPLFRQVVAVKFLRVTLLTALLSLFTAAGFGADAAWLTDYKKAQEQARADKKLLLLDFTGSDWCGWCMRLKKEVFSQPQFQEYASKNLVLMEVDFPRGKSQAAALQTQNMQLAEHYAIAGFPTIIVLNGDGKKVGELGYMPGGATEFIAQLEKLRKG